MDAQLSIAVPNCGSKDPIGKCPSLLCIISIRPNDMKGARAIWLGKWIRQATANGFG